MTEATGEAENVCAVFTIRYDVYNQLRDVFLSYEDYFKPFSSVLQQIAACERQRMISGDIYKHFSNTILPKCSRIYMSLGGIFRILCAIAADVSGQFRQDLNSFPLIFEWGI